MRGNPRVSEIREQKWVGDYSLGNAKSGDSGGKNRKENGRGLLTRNGQDSEIGQGSEKRVGDYSLEMDEFFEIG